MTEPLITRIDVNAIYDVHGAAAAIGMSETFIRRQMSKGALKFHRLGKKNIKIKGSDLQKWFDAQLIVSDDMDSCPQKKAGSPSGTKTIPPESVVENAIASALSGQPQKVMHTQHSLF